MIEIVSNMASNAAKVSAKVVNVIKVSSKDRFGNYVDYVNEDDLITQ